VLKWWKIPLAVKFQRSSFAKIKEIECESLEIFTENCKSCITHFGNLRPKTLFNCTFKHLLKHNLKSTISVETSVTNVFINFVQSNDFV